MLLALYPFQTGMDNTSNVLHQEEDKTVRRQRPRSIVCGMVLLRMGIEAMRVATTGAHSENIPACYAYPVSLAYGCLRSRRKAARAAQYPHIPCTPPPGGVEDEQM